MAFVLRPCNARAALQAPRPYRLPAAEHWTRQQDSAQPRRRRRPVGQPGRAHDSTWARRSRQLTGETLRQQKVKSAHSERGRGEAEAEAVSCPDKLKESTNPPIEGRNYTLNLCSVRLRYFPGGIEWTQARGPILRFCSSFSDEESGKDENSRSSSADAHLASWILALQ
eukprot:scaffold2968_cov321-Pinguiococcus_pyrenoidosus.AAC.18